MLVNPVPVKLEEVIVLLNFNLIGLWGVITFFLTSLFKLSYFWWILLEGIPLIFSKSNRTFSLIFAVWFKFYRSFFSFLLKKLCEV